MTLRLALYRSLYNNPVYHAAFLSPGKNPQTVNVGRNPIDEQTYQLIAVVDLGINPPRGIALDELYIPSSLVYDDPFTLAAETLPPHDDPDLLAHQAEEDHEMYSRLFDESAADRAHDRIPDQYRYVPPDDDEPEN